jgi:hypothetical protein
LFTRIELTCILYIWKHEPIPDSMEKPKYIDRLKVRSVLILYEDDFFFIGDACIILDKLHVCKKFFEQAKVDINFLSSSPLDRYLALLQNNPYLDDITQRPLESLDVSHYEIVICVVQDEIKIERWLQTYTDTPAVFSFSQLFFPTVKSEQIVFLPYEPLLEFARATVTPKRLYISKEEKTWAESWLDLNGVRPDEQVFVILDSASKREKLLNIGVYMELVSWLLRIPKTKILIFDERNAGKDLFYRELAGPEHRHAIVYSRGLSLREDLCLLSSGKVRLVIGPCTGLMHCASAIYNRYVDEGLPVEEVPAMVTYTGKNYQPPYYWWKNSPLTDVLIIRKGKAGKEMVLLEDLAGPALDEIDSLLTCGDYTAPMLISHIQKRLENN